ncbi:hypothetical protein C1645_778205, partial [Glomus cerebriforme]
MANEHRQPTNSNSPGLQGVPHMEQSINPTLNDVRQPSQKTDVNGSQIYKTSDKDWESMHRGPSGSGVISNSSGSNVHSFVKLPPGFNNMNNGVSGNTGNGDYNNRSFSHGSDNAPMPVGSGLGRSNSISVIPQSTHGEEYQQQPQQNLYNSYGNSFLTSPPLRASKNNSGFGGMRNDSI